MRASDTLTAALDYASRGWAVLPIRAGSKVPLTQHGVKDASTGELVIRGWWRTWPDANVGIATGAASGLVVLDVDPRSGGAESLATLAVPATLTARTGGGGHHYLFAAGPGPRRGRGGWKPGLDLKADGGYIVAAPSSHTSGLAYAWVDDGVPLAPEPAWLSEATSPPARPVIVPVARPVSTEAHARRVRAWIAKCPASIQGSNGSGALMTVAGRVASEEQSGRLGSDDAWALLCEFNQRSDPPWSEQDLQRALENARREPKQRPLEDRERPRPMSRPEPTREANWMELLLYGKQPGQLIKCPENAEVILRFDPRWRGRVRLDTFAQNVRVNTPPWQSHQHSGIDSDYWRDTDDTRLQGWLVREYGLQLTVNDCARVVASVAEGAPMHPVRDWMASLVWDGVPRLSRWLTTYLGVEDNEYASTVGRLWLVSAVARTYRPGCKADHVLILEGAQGIGKSSALRTLAGEDWFADTPFEIGNKDAYIVLCGKLIVELSELASLRGADANRAKNFFTSSHDSYVPKYARRSINAPRQCVFAGTTNEGQYLVDHTGARRYWPVACSSVDLAALRRDRDQLWAEAVSAYNTGMQWWPGQDIQAALADQQEERQVGDEWEVIIDKWAAGRDRFEMSDVRQSALRIDDVTKWGRREETRAGWALSRLGWEARQARRDGSKYRYYVRK